MKRIFLGLFRCIFRTEILHYKFVDKGYFFQPDGLFTNFLAKFRHLPRTVFFCLRKLRHWICWGKGRWAITWMFSINLQISCGGKKDGGLLKSKTNIFRICSWTSNNSLLGLWLFTGTTFSEDIYLFTPKLFDNDRIRKLILLNRKVIWDLRLKNWETREHPAEEQLEEL